MSHQTGDAGSVLAWSLDGIDGSLKEFPRRQRSAGRVYLTSMDAQHWKKSLPGPLDEVNAELLRTGHANGELVCEKLRGTQIIVPAADTTSPCVHSSAWREIEGAGSGKHPGVIGEGRDQWMRAI